MLLTPAPRQMERDGREDSTLQLGVQLDPSARKRSPESGPTESSA